MNERKAKQTLSVLLLMILLKPVMPFPTQPDASLAIPLAQEQTKPVNDGWSPPVEARRRNLKVASYRAKVVGDTLLVEVTHEPGWHTYALDNLERAKKKAVEPLLGIEKSTRIVISGGLRTVGKWRQSPPKDLSQPEISWFTWGFEGTALFAVKTRRIGRAPEALITINGQACKETTCVLIDDLEIRLPLNAARSEKTSFDLSSLIEQGDLKDIQE
jgi:hypothetical protein